MTGPSIPPPTSLQMSDLIAIVGRGKTLARDLRPEEARQAMRFLLEAQATPYQIGAFLIALRMKGETEEELAAFVEVVREHTPDMGEGPREGQLDLPLYAGRARTFLAMLPAAFVLAAGGVPVLIHGYSGYPGRTGPGAILEAAGIRSGLEIDQAMALLEQTGFAYLELSHIHLLLYRYLELRRELGLRTFFHTLLRIYDPARAGRHLVGVTHPPYLRKLGGTLQRTGSLRALIFRGVEGDSEIPLHPQKGVVILGESGLQEVDLDPQALDLPLAPQGGLSMENPGPMDQARRLVQVLSGGGPGLEREAVLWNAAWGFYVAGKVTDPAQGVVRARELLESGAVGAKFLEVLQTAREV